jgi:hypothetical protein
MTSPARTTHPAEVLTVPRLSLAAALALAARTVAEPLSILDPRQRCTVRADVRPLLAHTVAHVADRRAA